METSNVLVYTIVLYHFESFFSLKSLGAQKEFFVFFFILGTLYEGIMSAHTTNGNSNTNQVKLLPKNASEPCGPCINILWRT